MEVAGRIAITLAVAALAAALRLIPQPGVDPASLPPGRLARDLALAGPGLFPFFA